MGEHHEQMIDEIGRFPHQVQASGVARFAGCLDDFGGFLGDFRPDALYSAGQKLAGIRFFGRVLLAALDGGHQPGQHGLRFSQVRPFRLGDSRPQSIYYFAPTALRQVKSDTNENPAASAETPLADCWFLTGPTASGKTAVGLELARQLHAEILSLDSMAVYRRLDIGTAKPSLDDRQAVPHHLIDLVEPDADFSLAQYIAAAEAVAAEVRGRGHEVLFVGGTPLYLKALLRGIFEGPPADWDLRRRLMAERERHGAEWLHARLADVDPAAAGRLHARDVRRVIRALEVFEKTGRPISDWQQQFDRARPASERRVFVLDRPRDELYRSIDARVDAMFAAGLVDEARELLASPKPLSRTARQALGYREVIEHLEHARSLEQTIDLVKTRTRQFAKRQLTWFRSLSECRWVQVSPEQGSEALADVIIKEALGVRR